MSVLLVGSYVGLTMIDAKGCGGWRIGAGEADVDQMELRVVCRWNKAQVVFVADELRDLLEDGGKILRISGEVGTATIGLGDGS